MKVKIFVIIFLSFITYSSYAQSLNYDFATTKDSTDYYLSLVVKNNENKTSFKKSIEYACKAFEYAKDKDSENKVADVYLALSSVYASIHKQEIGVENLLKSIELYKANSSDITTNLPVAYLGLCKNYLAIGQNKLAEKYLDLALHSFYKFDNNDYSNQIKVLKGRIAQTKGNNDEAILIFNDIIHNKTIPIGLKIDTYIYFGELETQLGNYPKAIDYYKEALALNDKKRNFSNQLTILKNLSEVYTLKKDFKKSNKYLSTYTHLNDSINTLFQKYLAENNIDRIQLNTQQKTIETLDKEKQDQQKSIQFSRLISILSIALISILSLLSLSLYKNNKLRVKSNNLLQEKNAELLKQKEKAEKASEARAEFLATVSHELRTPLNAINGITYLLLQEKPRNNQLNYLKSLEFSGSYLIEIINDILEINRLDSDKIMVENISFNLSELIQNIVNSFQELIAKNNITYYQNIDSAINYNIVGDQTKLSQILINLLANAIKFSKNGKVWLTINQKVEVENSVVLHFEIKDNGIGIPIEKQKDIFENFNQGSVEINRIYGGTGLGLSIVKKILDILDSEIHLESVENKGATFSFDLKFEKTASTQITSPKTNEILFQNKKVLLIEDNQINQMITKKMLENKGVKCTILQTGEEAVEHLKNNHYDLVLMDVHLQESTEQKPQP